MPLVGIHRLQRHIPPVLEYPRGHLLRQPLQALLPFKPVVFRVHMYPDPLLAALVDGVIGQLLDCVQGLAPASNERPQLLPLQDDLIPSLGVQIDLHLGAAAHMLQQTRQKRRDLLRLLVIAGLAKIYRRHSGLGFSGLLRGRPPGRSGLPLVPGPGGLLFAPLRLPLLLGRGSGNRLLRPLRLFSLFLRGAGHGGLLHRRRLYRRWLLRRFIGDPHLGGACTDAQKSLLRPLQNFHGHIVPLQTQLGQGAGDGLVLGLAGDVNKFRCHILDPHSLSSYRSSR